MENPASLVIIKMSKNMILCFQTKCFAKWIVHQQQHSFSSQDPYLVFMVISNYIVSKSVYNELFPPVYRHDVLKLFHQPSNPPSFCKTTILPPLVLAMAAAPWLLEQGWLQELGGSFEKTAPLVRGRRETRREMPWRLATLRQKQCYKKIVPRCFFW